MSIDNIHLNVYPRTFIDSSSHLDLQNDLSSIIHRTLTHLDVHLVDIFMLTNPFHQYNAGRTNERLVIFINGTQKTSEINESNVLDTNTTLFGVESTFTNFLPPSGNGVVIKSDEGVPVAEWFNDTWELNILFDLFDNNTNLDDKLSIFTAIMRAFNEQILYQKTLQYSWKFGNQQDKLHNTFCSLIKRHREQHVSNDKRQIQQWERDLVTYQRTIKTLHDQLIQKKRQLSANENYLTEILNKFENDLNILIQHEKIKDIHINDEFITIFTIPLRIYASNNRIYQGGEYTIKIDMFSSDVSFDSNCKHPSFWSTTDPHPHVDGTTNKACLGNIESTVAELCSQMQLYALTMILIDFLESANVSDAAGKCVVNWTEIDKDGNIIIKDDNSYNNNNCNNVYDYRACDYCGEIFRDDELYEVYNNIDIRDDITHLINEILVCDSCRDDYYYWYDSLNAYISNEIDYDD